MDDDIKIQIRTALNTGQRPHDVARRFGVSVRTITGLAKARHRFREPKMPVECDGKILHAVGVLAKWCERPERADDARRRAASKKLTDALLAKHGLTAPKNPIIVPDTAPSRSTSWRRKARKAKL